MAVGRNRRIKTELTRDEEAMVCEVEAWCDTKLKTIAGAVVRFTWAGDPLSENVRAEIKRRYMNANVLTDPWHSVLIVPKENGTCEFTFFATQEDEARARD